MENGLDNKAIKVFTPQELKEKFENQLDNTCAIINETIADKKLLPFEESTQKTLKKIPCQKSQRIIIYYSKKKKYLL